MQLCKPDPVMRYVMRYDPVKPDPVMIKSAASINAGLKKLQATLADDEHFKSADFQARLKEFRVLVAGK